MTATAIMKELYIDSLLELGREYPRLVVLDADLAVANGTDRFQARFPERFVNAGIAEQNMVGVAAGLAASGLIPVAHSIAVFATGRPFGQLRQSVSYSEMNVKIVGGYAGFSAGADGASHQSVIDIAIMRALPHFTVLVPADPWQAQAAARAMVEHHGPVYLRLCNAPLSQAIPPDTPFQLGRAQQLRQGNDVTLIATGCLVAAALQAADTLREEGIEARVLNIHTIKPLDEEAIHQAAADTGALVVAEEHSLIGGLGSAVSELLADSNQSVPLRRLGIRDRFGESGSQDELLQSHGLTSADIAREAHSALDTMGSGLDI